jgi:hypothetical protein
VLKKAYLIATSIAGILKTTYPTNIGKKLFILFSFLKYYIRFKKIFQDFFDEKMKR